VPVNYLSLQDQIKKYGESAAGQKLEFEQKFNACLSLFKENAGNLIDLQRMVEEAATQNKGLRCAVPVDEPLDTHIPAPRSPAGCTIIAADGSQINPDTHGEVLFALVNIGLFTIQPGSHPAPRTETRSSLLYDDTLQTPNGLVSEDLIALLRDVREREILAEVTKNFPSPVITLTDGPLELYHEPRQDKQFETQFQHYLRALDELSLDGIITAGYVDRPRADLVVRLLELLVPAGEAGKEAPQSRAFRGIPDRALFQTLLQPGERSAVFALQSSSAHSYEGRKALHFFYLNSGSVNHPALARVEIPAWVAQEKAPLETLHAVLVEQSRQTGSAPYPYPLLRAHEVAVVKMDDRSEVIRMIERELIARGFPPSSQSFKQINKGFQDRKGI
jgi:hypothetical protein